MGISWDGYPAGVAINSTANLYLIADKRRALMDKVTGNETPAELAAIAAEDKALAMEQARESVNAEYADAWLQANAERAKKDREQRRRMLDAGVIFF